MYAIFEDGARQYRVSVGEVVKVDYRGGDDGEGAAKGTAVEFPRVLLYRNGDNTQIGQPVVAGARIVGEVVDHPSIKTYIGKFRRRKNYRRLRGHRQFYTAVRVKHILLSGEQPVEQPKAEQPQVEQQQQPAGQPTT
jgi:large subunit ribosomal protein L21